MATNDYQYEPGIPEIALDHAEKWLAEVDQVFSTSDPNDRLAAIARHVGRGESVVGHLIAELRDRLDGPKAQP